MKSFPLRRRSIRTPRIERLESREVFSATVFEHGNIGYFVDAASPQIERYDIAAEAWLTPVDLAGAIGTPTVAHVDDDGIYAAYGKSVYRYNLDGTGQTHLLNLPNNAIAIHSDGNLLFLNHTSGLYARFVSINKTTNTIIHTIDNYVESVYGSSISQEANRIFGRTGGISPSDITYMSYNDSGMFTGGTDSPYHGDYPGGSTTWVFPGGSKVVDNSGTIYATSNLTRLNSFGTMLTDIDFYGEEIPIVLSGNKLTAFSRTILPSGSKTLGFTPQEIFVNDTHVIAFTVDASSETGYRADLIPLSELSPPTPGAPINPVGLAYSPDKIEQAADGSLLLLSKAHQSIFRWDPVTQTYTESIPLVDVPNYMAYSRETDTAYVAYSSGLIRKIDFGSAEPREVPFATLATTPIGLSTAGSYLFAADGSGAWNTHYTFAPDGTLVDHVDWNYYSSEYVWSDANQKMYFFRDDTSPNDLLWEEIDANGTTYPNEPAGGIGAKKDSPLHGGIAFAHPIRVSPDGSIVVIGSGAIFDAKTLAHQTMSLANSIKDAAWLGNVLYTTRNISGVIQYQQWSYPTYGQVKVVQASGTAHALLATAEDRLVGIEFDSNGVPRFRVMDANLEVVAPPAFVLSPRVVPENAPLDTVVGQLQAVTSEAGETFTYTLVAGEGDTDNASFTIADGVVKSAASFDFETKRTYSIRVRSEGSSGSSAEEVITIQVSNVNEQPTELTLAGATVAENLPIGTVAGSFTTTDPDANSGFTYSLVDGEGAADNASFEVVGNQLRTAASLNYEARKSYTIRVRTTDGGGLFVERAFTITVSDANDAPVLDTAPDAKLSSIVEDTTSNPGTPVSWLVYTRVSDADAAAVRGIAITGVTGTAHGTWQYSLDNGAEWKNLGDVAPWSARLLPAGNTTRVRFVPNANYNGQVQIQYRAWDQTQGTAEEMFNPSAANPTGSSSGSSAFSAEVETASLTVVAVNDAPKLNEQLSPALISINEDNRNSYGTPVWTLLKGVSDVDSGAARGLAITAASGSAYGVWQYTLDNGVSWKPLGWVSDSAARLLSANGNHSRIRFVPNPNFNGSAQITFRAWDQTQGTAGTVVNLSNAERLGGRNAFSTAFDTANISILPVNDAPILSLGTREVGYTRNSPAILLAGAATIKDFDSPSFNGGRLQVHFVTGGYPEDNITIGGPFKVVNGDVIWNNTATIGTLDTNSGVGTEPFTVRFNANATRYRVEQLLRSLKFNTTGLPGDRSLTFAVHDGIDAGNEESLTVHVS